MSELLREYRDLEMKTLRKLRDKVEASKYESNYIQEKSLPIEVGDKVELVIVDDRLIFIDDRGLYQSIFNEDLETLILLTT